MSVLNQSILALLEKVVEPGIGLNKDHLSIPPDKKLGDVAFGCFPVAKFLGKNPVLVATDLVEQLSELIAKEKGLIAKVSSEGAYVNFFVDAGVLAYEVKKMKFHPLPNRLPKEERKKILIEYASPNTHKDLHVGHLRNFVLGAAAVRLTRSLGHKVVAASYINDLGHNVAKCLWAYENLHKGEKVAKEGRIRFLDKIYVEATKKEESDPEIKKRIEKIQHILEQYHVELSDASVSTPEGKQWIALWKKTRSWSVAGFKNAFKDFSLPIDRIWFESDLVADTQKIVEDLREKKIAKESQGALIVDLSDENLGVNLLQKSDGTLLYNAKDLALALKKEKEVHPDESVYVVDARQSLAMQQLFATLKRMGKDFTLRHLSYEFVTLPEGAISSRKGNVIYYTDFRDEIIEHAKKEVLKRRSDWSARKVEKTARAVAFGAITFGLLKQDPEKKIIFSVKEALSFEGFTGPYLQYTMARIKSIERKARKTSSRAPVLDSIIPIEKELLLALIRFPDAIKQAATRYRPSHLCQTMFDLAKTFAVFYESAPVIDAESGINAFRLALVKKVADALEEGFKLLGIPVVDEM